ncbi:MAG: hypothetical protein R3E68_08760 [Burkholderiaceae bacterium]
MTLSLRQWLFNRSNRLACRVICDGDQPYLERYFLFRRLGLTAYLHRFVASDPDRGLHRSSVAVGFLAGAGRPIPRVAPQWRPRRAVVELPDR